VFNQIDANFLHLARH
jgi:protein phosphatase 1L